MDLFPPYITDSIAAVAVLATQYFLIGGVFRFSSKFSPDRLTYRICVTVLFCWAAIVAWATLLGVLALLKPWLFYSGLGMVGLSFRLLSPPPTFAGLNQAPIRRRVHWRRAHSLLWLALWATAISYVISYGLLRLPTDWDSLAYHLPIIAHWIQHESLLTQDCAFWYVPGNNELIGYWLVAGQSGDFWAGLNNLPVFILLVCASLELMIALRIRWHQRFLATIAIVSSFVFARQLISQENDVAVGTLFVTALLFGWRLINHGRRVDALLLCIAIGILMGIKYLALLYAATAFVTVLGCMWWWRGVRPALSVTGSVLVAAFCLSGFWYLRNWGYTGTPLFPKGFEWLGMPNLWAEMRPGNEYSTLMRGGTWERMRSLGWGWIVQAGPATSISIILSPILIFIGLGGWLGRNGRLSRFLAISLLGAIFAYANTPNVIESVFGTENMLKSQYHSVRFGMPMAVLAPLMLVSLIHSIRFRNVQRVALALWGALVADDVMLQLGYQLGLAQIYRGFGINVFWPTSHPPDPVMFGLLAVNLMLLALLIHLSEFQKKSRRCILVACVAVAAGLSSGFLSSEWHRRFDDHFIGVLDCEVLNEVPQFINAGDRLCVFEYRYYPFLGSRRSRRVIRPLYCPSKESILAIIRNSKSTHAIVRRHDAHWTRTYSEAGVVLLKEEEAFLLLASPKDCLLFQVNNEWARSDL